MIPHGYPNPGSGLHWTDGLVLLALVLLALVLAWKDDHR